jgi:hypothetical protein
LLRRARPFAPHFRVMGQAHRAGSQLNRHHLFLRDRLAPPLHDHERLRGAYQPEPLFGLVEVPGQPLIMAAPIFDQAFWSLLRHL